MKLQQQMEQQQLKLQQQQQQIEQQQLKLQQQQQQLQNTQLLAQQLPTSGLNPAIPSKPVTSVSSLIVSDLVAKSAPHQNHVQVPSSNPNDWREKERRWAQEELDRELQVSQ